MLQSVYTLIATFALTIGYQCIHVARDTVRLFNASTLQKSMEVYIQKNNTPPSDPIQSLVAEKLISQPIQDPVFTNATVIVDEYANMLFGLVENMKQYSKDIPLISTIAEVLPDNSLLLEQMQTYAQENEATQLLGIDTENATDTERVIELMQNGIAPDFLISYQSSNDGYEFSFKLESPLFSEKMKSDGGNDPFRYEIGNNLTLDTSVSIEKSAAIANNGNTVLIR